MKSFLLAANMLVSIGMMCSFAAAEDKVSLDATLYSKLNPAIEIAMPDISIDAEDIVVEPAFFGFKHYDSVSNFLDYSLTRIETPDIGPYSAGTFYDQTKTIGWDLVAMFALNTDYGATNWGWGSSPFHFYDEGFFGRDTYALGMDKLGHAYTSYMISEYFTQRIAHSNDNRAGAALTGAIWGLGVQTMVEVLDGFSGDYGFSKQDYIANMAGAGFSLLRSTVPGMAEKVDFRMEYKPSGIEGFSPVSDYSGQKYLLAIKLAGFEQFEDTPLRFVELQAGYFARGSLEAERLAGAELRRVPYFAVGVNLSELLNATPIGKTIPGKAANRLFEYVQMPYTYAATTQN
jgi:Predicted periplasmic lipoprotein (DUF2279)